MPRTRKTDQAHGWSQLMVAAEQGLLAQAKAEIEAGANVNIADEDGWTPLHFAALNNHTSTVKLLLSQPGVETNARNKWKSTPLILAASRGNISSIRLLTDHPTIDVDFQAAYYGRTALIEAARNGYVEIVELLLNKGADANLCDKTGRNTALIEAIKHRHENVIRLLLASRKVDFSDKDIRLSTLIWAGGACSPEIRSALDVEIQNFFEANKNTSARVN